MKTEERPRRSGDLDSQVRETGLRVRELRRLRGLTTRSLAEKAGVSPSLVNQIETAKTGASLGSLRRIASALDVPVAEFLYSRDGVAPQAGRVDSGADESEDVSARPVVVRKNRRKRLQLPASSISFELLTPSLRWNIEFLWVELKPDHAPIEAMSHGGQESALVLSGKMRVFVGDDEFVLGAGDTISFDSSIPHRVENIGKEKLIQICAITPPSF